MKKFWLLVLRGFVSTLLVDIVLSIRSMACDHKIMFIYIAFASIPLFVIIVTLLYVAEIYYNKWKKKFIIDNITSLKNETNDKLIALHYATFRQINSLYQIVEQLSTGLHDQKQLGTQNYENALKVYFNDYKKWLNERWNK